MTPETILLLLAILGMGCIDLYLCYKIRELKEENETYHMMLDKDKQHELNNKLSVRCINQGIQIIELQEELTKNRRYEQDTVIF